MGRLTLGTGQVVQGQAADGKVVREASAHGQTVRLVSLVRHGDGITLSQVRVASRRGEQTATPTLPWPHATQVLRRTCYRRDLKTGKVSGAIDSALPTDMPAFLQGGHDMLEQADRALGQSNPWTEVERQAVRLHAPVPGPGRAGRRV